MAPLCVGFKYPTALSLLFKKHKHVIENKTFLLFFARFMYSG